MATVTTQESRLRPELDRLLDRLRSRIRSYVALEGATVILAVAAGLFWITLLLDWGYFRLTNLELPVVVRATIAVAAVAMTGGAAISFFALRLARRLSTKALALVLERRFPEFDDRLILAVEAADRTRGEPHGALEEAMLARAVDDVAAAADRIDLADVFDRQPLRRAIITAAVLAAPVLVMAIAQPAVLATWWSAYGRLADTYHLRETTLRVTVLAPPDDRPRLLEPGDVYKHPRGAGLTLLLDVPEGERPDGRPWIVPESVYARRRTDAGGRQTLPAAQVSDRRFRIAVDGVRDGMDLWVTGGDYTNRSAYRIDVVDPPRVDRVELHNHYPAYTGLNDRDRHGQTVADRVVLNGPVAEVPGGTLVLFVATANKPIRNAHVRLGENQLVFGEFDDVSSARIVERAVLTVRNDEAGSSGRTIVLPPEFAGRLLTKDRQSIAVPLLLRDGPAGFLANGPEDRADLPQKPVFTVPLQTPIRITFEDADLVASIDPSRFDLRGVPDAPPEVKTVLRGVSSIITRTAVVPVSGTIRDDHGLLDARFDFKVDNTEKWSSRPLVNPPRGRMKELTLKRDAETNAEWLDTATLGLQLGQKLRVAIAASDGDLLTGPHVARGEEYLFTIVTAEELLTALYNQEVNLRKQFEQSLGEMKQVRQELAEHDRRSNEQPADADADSDADKDAVRSAADRAFAETQQNASEVRAVESSFAEILEQLVNNRVHTEKQLDRIRMGVLNPLKRLSSARFPKLDRALGELRLQIADGRVTDGSFDASLVAADELIAEMEAALQEMQDLAEFHEAIQELSEIFEDEKALLERTKEEQKRSVIDSLGDLLD